MMSRNRSFTKLRTEQLNYGEKIGFPCRIIRILPHIQLILRPDTVDKQGNIKYIIGSVV